LNIWKPLVDWCKAACIAWHTRNSGVLSSTADNDVQIVLDMPLACLQAAHCSLLRSQMAITGASYQYCNASAAALLMGGEDAGDVDLAAGGDWPHCLCSGPRWPNSFLLPIAHCIVFRLDDSTCPVCCCWRLWAYQIMTKHYRLPCWELFNALMHFASMPYLLKCNNLASSCQCIFASHKWPTAATAL